MFEKFGVKLISAGLLTLLFSGCVPTYSINPHYDNKTKIVTIDTLQLLNAEETLNRKPTGSQFIGNVHKDIRKYSFNNEQCKFLFFSSVSASGNVYLTSSFADLMKRRYFNKHRSGLGCEVLEISNLKLYECQYGGTRKFIGYSVPNENGYSSVESLEVDSVCFKTIKEYFKRKAKQDKVKLKAYSL